MIAPTTLASLAMLKVNYDLLNHDYVEYLRPFVLDVLSRHRPNPVADSIVRDHVQRDFGLSIPIRAIHLLLRRLDRSKLLTRQGAIYELSSEFPLSTLGHEWTNAKTQIQPVLDHLLEFAASKYGIGWTDSDAVNSIVMFLSHFSIECLRAYTQKTTLPESIKSAPQPLYIVSTFVAALHSNEPELFDRFILIVKGYLLSNALLCPELDSIGRKFDNVVFYFDTPLILRLLGLEGYERLQASTELRQMLRKLGAKVRIFDHTAQETYSVIRACEENIENPLHRGPILLQMRREGKTKSDLALVRSNLTERLTRLGVRKDSTPDYDREFQIDESILQAAIEEEVTYMNSRAREFDMNSIRSIYALRYGKAPVRIEDAGAVLVTPNSGLARAAFEFGKAFQSSAEVSTVITDYSLANLAWLKAPLGAPALPEKEVLSLCYAAMQPPPRLWNKYLDEIDKLKSDQILDDNDYALLRYSIRVRDELMEMTLGEDSSLTHQTISGILERTRAELLGQKDEDIRAAQEAKSRAEQIAEDLRSARQHEQGRIYWATEKASKWLANGMCLALFLLLLTGVILSSFEFKGRFMDSLSASLIAHGAILSVVVWTVLDYMIRVDLRWIRDAVASRLHGWLYSRAMSLLFGRHGEESVS